MALLISFGTSGQAAIMVERFGSTRAALWVPTTCFLGDFETSSTPVASTLILPEKLLEHSHAV